MKLISNKNNDDNAPSTQKVLKVFPGNEKSQIHKL